MCVCVRRNGVVGRDREFAGPLRTQMQLWTRKKMKRQLLTTLSSLEHLHWAVPQVPLLFQKLDS